MECCAKTRWNVKEVFKSAADAILHKDDKEDGKSSEETNKSQSVLRRFSWFTRRSSSGSDISDCNTVARSVSGSRRLSLFTTSWQSVEPSNLGLFISRAVLSVTSTRQRPQHVTRNCMVKAWGIGLGLGERADREESWRHFSGFFSHYFGFRTQMVYSRVSTLEKTD